MYFTVKRYIFRYAFILHGTWMVNSVAHTWGYRPYDRQIKPTQSWVTSFVALGEGWHNFHHTFPSDYKTAELPYTFNLTTAFIDFMALIGQAYDRKTTSQKVKTISGYRNTRLIFS